METILVAAVSVLKLCIETLLPEQWSMQCKILRSLWWEGEEQV
jgi:hypothetical protein